MVVAIVPIGGGNMVPAGTMAATLIVVSARCRPARLSHEAGAAPAPGDEREAAASKANAEISIPWTFIRPPLVETWTDRQTATPHRNSIPRTNGLLSPERQPLAAMLRSSLWAGGLTAEQLQRVEADVVELYVPMGPMFAAKGTL
jgi:hypothetical protein